uniref:Uncharacterized protein n=1 Tax=Pyrodinium bahamense TaxID=73915 RepID=A0A7R9ZX92_9DINO
MEPPPQRLHHRNQPVLAPPIACSSEGSSQEAALDTGRAETDEGGRKGGPLLPLHVGFAHVELGETWPWHELRVIAHDETPTEVGILALLEFMDYVLDLPQVCTGFMLTYNLEELGWPHMDVVMRIICWSNEPERQAKWHHRCLCWKIVIPDGFCFKAARLALSGTFCLSSPPCLMYLVTDPSEDLTSDTVVSYQPDDSDVMGVKLLGDLRAKCEEVQLQAASEDLRRHEPAAAPVARPHGELPTVMDVGFAEVHQGYSEADGMGYIKIFGRDADVTDEGLTHLMGFMDGFVDSPSAVRGFAITYDLRLLHAPSMTMVTRVAAWGGEPVRQEKWQRLNLVCKVVVSGGVRLMLARGVLSTFFFLCPPVCKTYLLSDPDEPEESSIVFEPSKPVSAPQEQPLAAPTPGEAVASWGASRGGGGQAILVAGPSAAMPQPPAGSAVAAAATVVAVATPEPGGSPSTGAPLRGRFPCEAADNLNWMFPTTDF